MNYRFCKWSPFYLDDASLAPLAAKLRRLAAEELMENADSYATHPFLTAACAEMSCDMPTLLQTLISETNRHSVCVTDVAAAINEEGLIARNDRQWSSMLQLLALSTVIQADINSFPLTLWVKAACFVLAIKVPLHARVLTLIWACPIFKANFSHYKFSNANLRNF